MMGLMVEYILGKGDDIFDILHIEAGHVVLGTLQSQFCPGVGNNANRAPERRDLESSCFQMGFAGNENSQVGLQYGYQGMEDGTI